MAELNSAASEYSRAEVGRVDGTTQQLGVRNFDPTSRDLQVREKKSESGVERRLVPMELVAYVAFIGEPPPAESAEEPDYEPLRIHLARGRTFLVRPTSDPHDPVGFHSVPVGDGGPFREIYFFQHGVSVRERAESIGDMLVRGAGVAQEDIQRGLERQAQLGRKRIGEILLEQKRILPAALTQALALQRRKRARLGEVLIEAGLAKPEDIEAALAEQRRHGGRRIGEILVETGVVTERVLAMTLAEKFHLAFVDLDECVIESRALRMVPRAILEKYRVFPIETGEEGLTVAISDPLNTEPIDLIRFYCGEHIREVVAVRSQIEQYLAEYLSSGESAEQGHDVATLLQSLAVDSAAEPVEDSGSESVVVSDSDNVIIQLANRIILEACRSGASDIHIEPGGRRTKMRIRFRIDGECVPFQEVPPAYRRALVSRFKIMAELDISERRKPQDGKIRIRLPHGLVELRVATIPTVMGEDVVLRILAASKPLPLAGMDLLARNLRELERLVRSPHGLLLCVGPTGSGKTTSLHSLLGHINRTDLKIWTAEDPVEITQVGLRQVQVHPKIGFGFAQALRAFLRADPDVIMVGEMRDTETAGIAVEASLTGHLVFSTLHTNSAAETVCRLIDMGIDPFTFGDALLGVLAQRLARRVCTSCRVLEPVPEDARETLHQALEQAGHPMPVVELLWRGRGCEACRGTGYKGRVALHELLVVDEEMRRAIHARANADTIRRLATTGGMTTLFQDGAWKCAEGLTDLRQVLAVCSR